MKKLINATDAVVAEALRGFEAAHADLVRVNHDPAYIVRADAPVKGKVGVLSGAARGTSRCTRASSAWACWTRRARGRCSPPTPDQMYEATKAVDWRRRRPAHRQELHRRRPQLRDGRRPRPRRRDRGRGGGHGRRRRRAGQPLHGRPPRRRGGRSWPRRSSGRRPRREGPLRGRRGLPPVNAQGRSMGMALTSCTVPAAGKPTFELGDEEMEIGIGIHGEPGRERVPLASAREIAAMLAEPDPRRPAVRVRRRGPGLRQRHGGTPPLELYIVYNELRAILDERGVKVGPQPRRAVHHLAGDGRLLDHAPQARRGADTPLGRPGQDRRAALGRMTRATSASGAGGATAPRSHPGSGPSRPSSRRTRTS